MKLKKLFALLLSLLLVLSFAACNGNGDSGNTEQSGSTDNGGNGTGTTGGESIVRGPLSGESDEALITRFLGEYEKAVTAPAYVAEYSLNSRLDGDTVVDAIGLFMVNGNDFSVDLETYPREGSQTAASCVYLKGTLYTDVNGVKTQTPVDAAAAKAQLDSLGMTYKEIATSDFASKTLTRNADGSFTVNVTLADGVLQEISAAALKDASGMDAAATVSGVTLAINFTIDGALADHRLITAVNVTVDGAVLEYRTEVFLKYTTLDASKIVITAPGA